MPRSMGKVGRGWRGGSAGFEGTAYPRAIVRIVLVLEADNVEAAGTPGMVRVSCQEFGGGTQEPLLLGNADRSDGIRTLGSGTRADFDENQHLVVQHDKVDFAMTAVEVARHELQSGGLELGQCGVLACGASALAFRRTAAGVQCVGTPRLSVPVTGAAIPLLNCTQIGVRCTLPCASTLSCPVAPAT